MEKKYILTDETVEHLGHTLYRIQAVKAFGFVSAGTLGGFIESEKNLDHDGKAWVFGNARVYDDAMVSGDAGVFGDTWVYDNARVFGDAVVSDNARAFGNAWVYGNAWVSGNAVVSDNARAFGDTVVSDNARVSGNAVVSDNARAFGNAWVYGNAWVSGNAVVSDNARAFGDTVVSGDAKVSGDACVYKPSDIASIEGFGSKFRAISFFRCVDGLVRCQCGCFYGTIDDFRSKVRETHGDSKYAKEYLMAADLMELHFKED